MTGDLSGTQESAAPEPADSAAALSARLLEEEALREQRTAAMVAELTDEQMPGVGLDEMSLRKGLKIGGLSMVVVLGLGQFIEFIDRSGFSVLAPDIQKTLHVSDAVIAAIGGAFGILFLAGSIPLSSIADRRSRTKLAAVSLGGLVTRGVRHRVRAERVPALHRAAREWSRPVVPAADAQPACSSTRTRSKRAGGSSR